MALLLCFEKYLHIIILSSFLVVSPLPIPATAVTAPLSALQPRAVAPFVPAAIFSSRVLAEDSQWKGAIQVEGMVTVAAQTTLTIMPGTVVRFGPDSGILVLGRIVAKGTKELPILFTSNYLQPAPSDWYGIVLTGTAKKNIFEQLKMHGAEAAIYARSSSMELRQLHIENSSMAITLADSIADFKEMTITGCSTGISSIKSEVDLESVTIEKGEIGLSVNESSLTATNLKISSSSKSAFITEKSRLKIEKSVFSGNLGGAMVIGCEGTVNSSKFIANVETAVVLSGSLLKFSLNLVSGSTVGVQLADNLASVWGNSIHTNSSYNLLYSGDENIYLGGNWLGTTSSELVNNTLFSKRPGAIKLVPLLATDPWKEPRNDF